MDLKIQILAVIAVALVLFVLFFGKCKEFYRSPIYLNKRKYKCDYYGRGLGSIYGPSSTVLSGFPLWDKAY